MKMVAARSAAAAAAAAAAATDGWLSVRLQPAAAGWPAAAWSLGRSVGGAETIYGYLLQLFSFRACSAKKKEKEKRRRRRRGL